MILRPGKLIKCRYANYRVINIKTKSYSINYVHPIKRKRIIIKFVKVNEKIINPSTQLGAIKPNCHRHIIENHALRLTPISRGELKPTTTKRAHVYLLTRLVVPQQ